MQVIIGMVMVAGWPIAHHVWAGNRIDHSTVQEVISDLCNRFEFGRLIFVGDRVRVHTLLDNCPRMTPFDGQTLMLENAAKTRAGTALARFSVPDLLHLDSPCRISKTHGAT